MLVSGWIENIHLSLFSTNSYLFIGIQNRLYETADRLYNVPSIVYYTIFNEGWGQFCADDMYKKLNSFDSTRITDSTSGWFRRHESDVDSRHIYFRPLKPKRLDGRPLVISEFGGYAHGVGKGFCKKLDFHPSRSTNCATSPPAPPQL